MYLGVRPISEYTKQRQWGIGLTGWFPVSQGSLYFVAEFPSVLKTVVLYILLSCLKTVVSY